MAFILHSFIALLGGTVGTILHPRIMKDRKVAVVLNFIISLMAMIKGAINIKLPITSFITWVFPPLYNIIQIYKEGEYFTTSTVAQGIGYVSIYCIVFICIQLYLLKKNKF
ncbi:hypothetical protein [Clostridium sp. Marseille-Q2269]|uniref:hypothetical protein n=1 Tax=Clostridium sp. Marseille-Q2269 TaxID=2942205 RepID=UPI00207443C0|nr:hypothetical protein [Clostridium sp. Marseille-Q2269]